ncbi:MAG: amidase domain-containing protein [Christensenellales bacterium]
MPFIAYDRAVAVSYARRWALARNPKYYDFSRIGGDCTNFVSQCLYAGSGVMNYKPTFGWYYTSVNNRAPSWTGVPFLYNFLTREAGAGPIGAQVSIENAQPGDVSQFADAAGLYYHSQFIVSVGKYPSPDNVLVCTHTFDSLDRALSSYDYNKVRFIHIRGVIT